MIWFTRSKRLSLSLDLLKGGKVLLVVSAFIAGAALLHAEPGGSIITAGSASIAQSGSVTNITQTTQKASIHWNSFSIGNTETVNFNQPDISSITLNRVSGNEKSIIDGTLNANGQVFILNANGILFGKNSRVNTAGLVATTMNLSDADFMNDNYAFKGDSSASIINQGTLTISDKGYAALIGTKVNNEGVIKATLGKVHAVGAGEITLNLNGNSLVSLTVKKAVLDAFVENKGAVYADGGEVYLTTNTVNELLNGAVNNTGIVQAQSLEDITGKIELSSNIIVNNGTLDASGINGGTVSETARMLIDAGTTTVNAATGDAGTITQNSDQIMQSTFANLNADSELGKGGKIILVSNPESPGNTFYLSGTMQAKGVDGGVITATSHALILAEASLDTSGTENAGTIKLGGGWQGKDTTLADTQNTSIDTKTKITNQGEDGTVVVWSEDKTVFGGDIKAPNSAVEISSKETLIFGGSVASQTLLLDPKNIEVKDLSGTLSYLAITDPQATAGDAFGTAVTELSNTNLVITAHTTDIGGVVDVGAFYLFSASGTLLSTITGTTTNDQVGNGGITALGNGNYVVRSSNWDNGAVADAGAVTWGNGTTGISGVISAANSLVGSTASDQVGSAGITILTNGNYVVRSNFWDNGAVANAGAVTWGNGTTGTSGVVSSANSLVGETASDQIGSSGIIALTNGNYVVGTHLWNNGAVIDAGAVTWGNGTTGTNGVVSAANSLVGSAANDLIGSDGIVAPTNGNYVVSSHFWNNGGVSDAGAATWGDGTTGISGVVSAANSLVGTKANDYVGNGGITTLANGNYVVRSYLWDNGAVADAGAVTWGDGTTGGSGAVSSTNSLVGTSANDQVGYNGITELADGNYVVNSANWSNGAIASAGAVSWGNGTTGISGAVSAANSLVGTTAFDFIGLNGVTALTNGNYVVSSSGWYNGLDSNAGAVTWGNGTTGISGVVSAANSLVGTAINNQVGITGITALVNGNYIVRSSNWDNGAVLNVGAVTWGNGATGISGAVSAANSLVGSTTDDKVGISGINALANGNYVVRSSIWDNAGALNAGAVTWGNGTTGISGIISAANSLVGTTTNNQVGSGGVTALSNDNYVVRSDFWDNGAFTNVGAVTWGNGATGISGAISAANSLVGTTADDRVGSAGITELSNGNYVVRSHLWDNAGAVNAGAVTWANGTTGISGEVSAVNSLVGTTAGDQVGNTGVAVLSNGNYVVRSATWDNGAIADAGAATWGDGVAPLVGTISSANSLIGEYASQGMGYNALVLNYSNRISMRTATTPIGGTVYILDGSFTSGLSDSVASATFADNPTAYSIITPGTIKALLDAGTAVTLQANNDITITDAVTANNAGGNGGTFSLQAGRNVNFNANIVTDNGNFNTIVGDPNAISADTDAGTPAITIASGKTIDAGTGTITLYANGGIFVNNAGAMPFTATSTKIYLPSYTNAILNGLNVTAKRYNTTYAGGCLTAGCVLPTTGINMLYAIAPILSVTPASGQTTIYGSAYSPSGNSLSGFVDGDVAGTSGISGTATYTIGKSTSAAGYPTAGAHDIAYASGLASSLGYRFSDNMASADEVSVTPKALVVTANNDNKIYNGLAYNGTNGVSYEGFANLEDAGVLGGDLAYGGTSQGAINAGTYTISTSGLSSTNYAISYVDGALTVAPNALVIKVNDDNKIYNGLAYRGGNGVSYEGFANIEDAGVLGGELAYGGTSQGAVNAGTYTISASGLSSTNYAISYIDGSVIVTPKALVVKANSDNKIYNGLAYSGGNGVSYEGFANLEDAGVLGGVLAYGGTSQGAINAGTYTICASGLSSTNYVISYIDGALTVDPLPVVPIPIVRKEKMTIERIMDIPEIERAIDCSVDAFVAMPSFHSPVIAGMQKVISVQKTMGTQEECGGNVRVSLMKNSLITILNGGVKLPKSVEQDFFYVIRI